MRRPWFYLFWEIFRCINEYSVCQLDLPTLPYTVAFIPGTSGSACTVYIATSYPDRFGVEANYPRSVWKLCFIICHSHVHNMLMKPHSAPSNITVHLYREILWYYWWENRWNEIYDLCLWRARLTRKKFRKMNDMVYYFWKWANFPVFIPLRMSLSRNVNQFAFMFVFVLVSSSVLSFKQYV